MAFLRRIRKAVASLFVSLTHMIDIDLPPFICVYISTLYMMADSSGHKYPSQGSQPVDPDPGFPELRFPGPPHTDPSATRVHAQNVGRWTRELVTESKNIILVYGNVQCRSE